MILKMNEFKTGIITYKLNNRFGFGLFIDNELLAQAPFPRYFEINIVFIIFGITITWVK